LPDDHVERRPTPTARERCAAGAGIRPSFTLYSAIGAPARRGNGRRARLGPPPMHVPLIAAMTGLASLRPRGSRWYGWVGRAGRGEPADVRAARKRVARAGNDDCLDCAPACASTPATRLDQKVVSQAVHRRVVEVITAISPCEPVCAHFSAPWISSWQSPAVNQIFLPST
jgi:hypothetical protein